MHDPQTLQHDTLVIAVEDSRQVYSYSLVLAAVNIPHRVNCLSTDHYEIYTDSHNEHNAYVEITTYIRENKNWPPAAPVTDDFTPAFLAMSPLIVGILVYIFAITGNWQSDSLWFLKGAGDSTAILNDLQLYRLVTPLTLHADIVHLMGNCFLGGFLLHFFLHITGNGIGLFAMATTAIIANFINVLVHGQNHHFVGFSTAIFSVIGMLCTISFTLKTTKPALHFFMSVMAGLALLAFLGSSGERTDLGAHLFGLLCGIISGNFVRLPWYEAVRRSFFLQTILGIAFFILFFVCWYIAFRF